MIIELAFAVVRIWRTFSKGIPLKSASMSARESMATPTFPTSPSDIGSSES